MGSSVYGLKTRRLEKTGTRTGLSYWSAGSVHALEENELFSNVAKLV